MTDRAPSTMLTDTTTLGRFYGQGADHEGMFDVITRIDGSVAISVRWRHPEQASSVLPSGASFLVQIFEQPGVLWLACATIMGGNPMMMFAPVEVLESADGRCEMPNLAEVSVELVDEAILEGMDAHDRT